MKKFRFRFGKMLETKTAVEDLRERQLAEKQRLLQEAQQQRQDTLQQIALFQGQLEKKQRHIVTLVELTQGFSYLERLQDILKQKEKHIQECMAAAAEARNRLILAVRDRKTFESLKARHWLEHRKDLRKEEAKLLDLVASRQFIIGNHERSSHDRSP